MTMKHELIYTWADLACEGEIYETRDFVVECLSFEEYNDYISEI